MAKMIIVDNYSGIKDMNIIPKEFEEYIKGKEVHTDYLCDDMGDHLVLGIGKYSIIVWDDARNMKESVEFGTDWVTLETDPYDIEINSRIIYERFRESLRYGQPIEFPKLWMD